MSTESPAVEVPPPLAEATEDQPAARAALVAALAAPAHAYLLVGPAGESLRAAARAFAAELLAADAPDPESARARALADPSPHPDLVWLAPPGGQHLVEEVRERVIRGAAYRPFEGPHRVFVIESADAMADESQNALLKTLEEPPPYAHLLLLAAETGGLRPTVVSRCQQVRFQALPAAALAERLAGAAQGVGEDELTAAARLSGGEEARARFLLTDQGRELRGAVERCTGAARAARLEDAPWLELLGLAEREGKEAGSVESARVRERAELSGDPRLKSRAGREADAASRRAGRRRRTEVLDLALALCAAWFRDLAAVAAGSPGLALNADRGEALAEQAEGLDDRAARRAAELALETRRRLEVNVSEELALEALFYRAEALLAGRSRPAGS